MNFRMCYKFEIYMWILIDRNCEKPENQFTANSQEQKKDVGIIFAKHAYKFIIVKSTVHFISFNSYKHYVHEFDFFCATGN